MNWLLFLFALTDLNPPEVQGLIKTGLDFSYVENFDSAAFYFQRVITLYPDNPAGYFFEGALLQLKMMDGCQYREEKEYLGFMKKALDLAAKILKKEDNPWAEFYQANHYVYRAVYEGTKRNYLETFNYGLKGGRMMQVLLKKDSTFYDAYLAVGTFEYFWARAGRYLPILKLAGGDANEAIRKLRVAADKSLYSGPTAENSLTFVYTEEGDYGKARQYADPLLVRYPQSKTFMWNKAGLEFRDKNYAAAAESYQRLFQAYESLNNYANLCQCKLFIGKCYYALQDRVNARQALKDAINYRKYSDSYPPIKNYVREAYSILSKIL
jgi:tetratricopeptide (TPR) repeat protein